MKVIRDIIFFADVNECLRGNVCKGIGERCINIPGSYGCVCKVGFRHDTFSNQCQGDYSYDYTIIDIDYYMPQKLLANRGV